MYIYLNDKLKILIDRIIYIKTKNRCQNTVVET